MSKKDKDKGKDKGNETKEVTKATGSAIVGVVVGGLAVEAAGLTAIGAVGSGTGFGAAAGPVGMALGALGGLAFYGIYKAFN